MTTKLALFDNPITSRKNCVLMWEQQPGVVGGDADHLPVGLVVIDLNAVRVDRHGRGRESCSEATARARQVVGHRQGLVAKRRVWLLAAREVSLVQARADDGEDEGHEAIPGAIRRRP